MVEDSIGKKIKLMYKIVLLIIFVLILLSCKQTENKKNKDISQYLITYYEEKFKIKPDSVQYTLTPTTDKEHQKYQADIYKLEQLFWDFSDYSEDFAAKKKDENKWKEDSCLSLMNKADSVTTTFYKANSFFFIQSRIDTIEEFYLDKNYKIIPLFKLFELPMQMKTAIEDGKHKFF